MARQASKVIIDLEVKFIPMPEDHEDVWRASHSLLLQLFEREKIDLSDGGRS